MCVMPEVVSVSAGITDAGSVGHWPIDGGHLFWVLGFDDGGSVTLEAGPSGPLGTGNLVTQNYGSSGTVDVVANSGMTAAGLGQALLGAYSAYQAGQNVNPVQYSVTGGGTNSSYGNSNSYFASGGAAAGLSQGAVDQVVTSVQDQSGLTAYGADNFGITDRFSQVISGGDDGGGGGGGGELEC